MFSKFFFLLYAFSCTLNTVHCKYTPRTKVFTIDDDHEDDNLLYHLTNVASDDGVVKKDHPDPDIPLTTPELIRRHGFPAEVHTVTTADGYILTLHRIPYGKTNFTRQVNGTRPVVFLQHGMFGTSSDWILNVEQKCLAYMLANSGYDVWLGNARGNKYSQAHTSLSIKQIKFWRFSWDEMGRFDMPAVLNYVLNTTDRSNLSYVGHSMGTTMFFVLLSTHPEFKDKINFMGAFGPAVFLNHGTGPAKMFGKLYGRTERLILDIAGHGIFLPKFIVKTIHFIGPEFCTEAMKVDHLCEEAMFLLAGHDPAQTNYTQLPVILAHVPSTVSTQTGFHYFQIIKSGQFSMYDHGKGNEKVYGSKTPPLYDLSKVDVPVALFWGQNDIICNPVDVGRLSRALPQVTLNHRVQFPEFNHVDFIFAKDADVLVNLPLLEELAKYN